MSYPFSAIEPKWQAHWEEEKTFRTPDSVDYDRPKYYVLDMFPYPSGAGLHVGHPEGYTATDIVARYKRMQGFNVLHPMGWDAFGLPAEQYAIETGTHPRETTERNVARFREQLKALGFSYDWDREINTTDPDYYKWTQWIFLQLHKKGLAYQAEVPVWWCPALGTTLANEEVIDGKSERGGHPCVRRPLRQWMLKITDYADRLLEGLDELDWPESTKEMQRNWIGRSEGAEITFEVKGLEGAEIHAFTPRPDTLFGATYMVLAPEHELVDTLTTEEYREVVEAYREEAIQKSELERTELQKEKTGVFTGGYAINPATGEEVPVWVADYVLASYGTGAIMAVPAHDERDYEFARKYELPIREVIEGGDITRKAYTGDGMAINSTSERVSIDGLPVEEAKAKMIEWLEESGHGQGQVNYKLRDWLFSRQRYWGEPFPIMFVDGEARPVSEDALPVTLPDVDAVDPGDSPEGPLAAEEAWVETTDPETDAPAQRETNTMPQWAGSCWYYLRFIDPHNEERLLDPEKEEYWMPVDLYVGGSEHAVLHLLYARFWHKVLYDAGVVSTEEPFKKLVHQGLILGEMEYTRYLDEHGSPVSAEHVQDSINMETGQPVRARMVEPNEVTKRGEHFVLEDMPHIRVDARAHKMSKSRGNVVNPDDVIEEYGADSLRLYEMFMGPLEQVKPWSTKGVEGVHRFLGRVWRLIVDEEGELKVTGSKPSKKQLRALHQVIQKVGDDIEELRFNTAIAAMMEFVNKAYKWEEVPREAVEPFIQILSPFAPHIAEELWARFGHEETLAYEPWPEVNEEYLKEDTVEIAVQVNGKVRGTVSIAPDAEKETALDMARQDDNVRRYLKGATIRREIYVPGRIINFVAEGA